MSERPYMYTYIYFLGSDGSCFVSTINRRINYLTEFTPLTITSAPQKLGFYSLSVFCVLTSSSDLSMIPHVSTEIYNMGSQMVAVLISADK